MATHRDRGAGSLLLVGAAGVLVLLTVGFLVLGHYLVLAHRARAVADLAAVAGAQAYARDQDADPCAAARRTAEVGGARVARCHRSGDEFDFVVAVRVELPASPPWPGLPDAVPAAAYAGPNRF